MLRCFDHYCSSASRRAINRTSRLRDAIFFEIYLGSIMAMCIGAVVGWSSPSLVKLMEPDSPIQVTTSDLSTLVALVPLGKICGPLINRFIVDRAGRKNAVLLGGASSIICWGLISIATNIWVRQRFSNSFCKKSLNSSCQIFNNG